MNPTTTAPGTIVTAPQGELSPIEAAIMDACNEAHEARATGDEAHLESARRALNALLSRYEATNAEAHPNPAWALPSQRALAQSALGDVEGAIETEFRALAHADTSRRLEISLGNIADRCVRAGRVLEAVDFFLRAWDAAPRSVPVMLTGVQALYLAGMRDEANDICAALLDMPELLNPASELAAHLDLEPRFEEMSAHLPALARLMGLWRDVCPAR
ncbi:MAG: hypothetical protein IT439_12855 [Phycisphaerales bacterium]|nr:hypothetical protein [Phycisphaerales bacterium]